MKKVAMIPLAMGLLIGGVAIKLGLDTLQEAKAGAQQQMITTVVAVSEIPATTAIEPSMLTQVETPETPLLGRGYFTDPKELVGRVLLFSIAGGAVVRESLLAPKGTPPGLAVRIKPGYRAVSVKVNEVTGVAYQLRPGARVDVLAMMAVQRNGVSDNVSRAILQDIEIAAVGRALNAKGASEKGKATKSVTLLVKNEEAPMLHLAQTRGKITLALRSGDDNAVTEASSASENELLSAFGQISTESASQNDNTQVVSSRPPSKPKVSGKVTVVHGDSRYMHDFSNLAGTFARAGAEAKKRSSGKRVRATLRSRDKGDAEAGDFEPAPG